MAQASAVANSSLLVMLMLLFLPYHVLLSVAVFVEPPFTPAIIENILASSKLPSLIDEIQLATNLNPLTVANFLGNAQNTQNSQPNPIADTFPNATIGTINATHVLLPIDYKLARSIIPQKYGILRRSIREALPGFPRGKYPLFLSTQIDHDVQNGNFSLPDFSVAGAGAYGEKLVVGTFQPPKDPYAFVPAGKAKRPGEYFFNVYRDGVSVFNTTYAPKPGPAGLVGAYPLSFYANVTNQPTFGCDSASCVLTCDNMIRFFRTRITTGEFTPIGVEGSVSLAKSDLSGISIFPNGFEFDCVYGVKLDMAFLEHNFKDCKAFKGYEYEDEI